jgi:hypothetical protein
MIISIATVTFMSILKESVKGSASLGQAPREKGRLPSFSGFHPYLYHAFWASEYGPELDSRVEGVAHPGTYSTEQFDECSEGWRGSSA